MFGMLDYRAHKLYIILFFIPNLILNLFAIFGIKIISIIIGLAFADERIFQFLIALISIFIIELIWILIIFGIVTKAFQFIFELFVDVIPDDGRTREEAQLVVWRGSKAIRSLEVIKHPSQWDYSKIEEIYKNDWVANIFYRNKISKRTRKIFEHYLFQSDKPYNDAVINKFLEENNLKMSWKEMIFTEPFYRNAIIGYSFFLFLLILNPFS
ncbi:MAG: hypothetical protein CMQ53_03865 [Gammaproteobacteria bacterium]|nr:hypothetical protein [Gammaproteobacteria bacterium]|tara:strand:- start:923 stop:1558 length:636 start_codon:yes stop_codon:yes gene_type:complete